MTIGQWTAMHPSRYVASRPRSYEMTYPFIGAKWFTPTNGRTIDLIVLHSMESPEKGDSAEACANYFKNGSGGRKASAHYLCDNNSTVQAVRDRDVAYGAPGANSNGLHIEQAGTAAQSRSDWLDDYGKAMLFGQVVPLVAALCTEYGIPAVFLSAADLKAGKRGVTTHAEVTAAFHQSTHTDPGSGYPMDLVIQSVQARLNPSTTDEEQELMAAKDDIIAAVNQHINEVVLGTYATEKAEDDKRELNADASIFARIDKLQASVDALAAKVK